MTLRASPRQTSQLPASMAPPTVATLVPERFNSSRLERACTAILNAQRSGTTHLARTIASVCAGRTWHWTAVGLRAYLLTAPAHAVSRKMGAVSGGPMVMDQMKGAALPSGAKVRWPNVQCLTCRSVTKLAGLQVATISHCRTVRHAMAPTAQLAWSCFLARLSSGLLIPDARVDALGDPPNGCAA